MKAGETAYLKIKINNLKIGVVRSVVFTLKSQQNTITKTYPDDVTFDGDYFMVGLNQQETSDLAGYYMLEAQVNYVDKSVSKTESKRGYVEDTVATLFLIGNEPQNVSEQMALSVSEVQIVHDGGGGGSSDYRDLENKPLINGIVLLGNKTFEDLGLDTEIDTYIEAHKEELKGADGYTPQKGVDYFDGADGFSPSAKVERVTNGAKITITDKDGTTEAIVNDGSGGSGGDLSVKTLIDTLSANRKRDFAFRDMPKAQFALIIDDCLPSVISECVTNAKTKNVPLNMSAISEYFNDLCTKGNTSKSVLEEIKRGVENGGEVLLHGNGTINATNIDNEEFLQEKFLGQKEIFIENGLNPRGAIVIGGGDEIYKDVRTDRWVRALFDYSDGWGVAEPYYHRRNAPTTLDSAKAIIDSAIANKTFCPIFAHKWYDFWNEMIDYVRTLGGEWVTYSTVYDTYGTTKSVKAMETRIKALEQGGGGKTLVSISANKTKTTYNVGDTLNIDDITVIANYSDESTEIVTDKAVIDKSGVVMSASGTYSINVSYSGMSTSISIVVEEAPSGTVIYQVASISGTCSGTSDQKVGSSSTSWVSGKQYRYEFDYEVTAVADDSVTVNIRDVNGSSFIHEQGVIPNASVGMKGHVDSTQTNASTRNRQAFVLKNTSNKSYSVTLTNVKVTEL